MNYDEPRRRSSDSRWDMTSMNDHRIEARLLRLAEAATPAFTMFQKALGTTGLSADAALIAALDPATVSRLARVVAVVRPGHMTDGRYDHRLVHCPTCAALSALDADAPEGGHQ